MKKLCLLLLVAITACAETDPYKRLERSPTGELNSAQAAAAFATRWPIWFKCVQTVTVDFGPVSRTLVGYLAVQTPDSFRLQGMTEQGLKLFDVACNRGQTHVYFSTEELDDKLIENVVRDIERVFMSNWELTGGEFRLNTTIYGTTFEPLHPFPPARVDETNNDTRARFSSRHHELRVRLSGKPALVEDYEVLQSGQRLCRVDQYEWRNFGDFFAPSVIVLREPGIQSDGPAYKLTIKITELAVRDKPWPEKMFLPTEKDD